MGLFTTEMDRCFIGCGEPLIFLRWNPHNLLLFWCPSCRGIWDKDLLDLQNATPTLYGVEEFGVHSITLPSLPEISAVWKNEVVRRSGQENQQYRNRMRAFFANKLWFQDENAHPKGEEKGDEKGTQLD